MTPAELAEHAEQLVADWPEFTAEQIEHLSVLLRPRRAA